jgi:hypothetical protein
MMMVLCCVLQSASKFVALPEVVYGKLKLLRATIWCYEIYRKSECRSLVNQALVSRYVRWPSSALPKTDASCSAYVGVHAWFCDLSVITVKLVSAARTNIGRV